MFHLSKRLLHGTPRVFNVPRTKPSALRTTWKVASRSVLAAVVGAGAYVSYKLYEEVHPAEQQKQLPAFENGMKKKTLVILGSGWGLIPLLKNLDTTQYNVVIVLPRNYFLFTPLLPSCPTGTVELRLIIEPVRAITRKRKGEVLYLEAEATDIDPVNRKITLKQLTTVHSGHLGKDLSSLRLTLLEDIITHLEYDYLVVGVGAMPLTFGIPGVAEHLTFLKEVSDSIQIRRRLMDVIEAANILPRDDPERKRLLNIVICGGGPTGVEVAGELQDYIDQDLKLWMPEVAEELHITLVEAMPHVLLTFNEKLVEYTQQVFQDTNINLVTNTMITKVTDTRVTAHHKADGTEDEIPYGMLIWATGNAIRPVVKGLIAKIEQQKNARRGLLVNEHLLVDGTDNIFALGDCTFTKYAPTAQVAFQQGQFLAKHLERLHAADELHYRLLREPENKERISRKLARVQKLMAPFEYNHQGALAYIGLERAVADLVWGDWSNVLTGGPLTFLFWRSAYIYMCLLVKNQLLVCLDWAKVSMFGRDISKE